MQKLLHRMKFFDIESIVLYAKVVMILEIVYKNKLHFVM